MNLSFVDSSSTMIFKLSSIESNWNSLLSSSTKSLFFPDPYVDNDLDNPGDQTWVEFTSLFSNESIFSRSVVDNDQDKLIDQSEWNSRLSPRLNLSFQDQSSRWSEKSLRWKMSKIHNSGSSRKYVSFLDPRSIMISAIPAIESEWNLLHCHRLNLCIF